MPSSRPTEPGRRLCSCGPPPQAERCRASLASGAASPSRWRSVRRPPDLPSLEPALQGDGSRLAGGRSRSRSPEISLARRMLVARFVNSGAPRGSAAPRAPHSGRNTRSYSTRRDAARTIRARRTWARIRDMRPVRSNAISRTPCSSGSACGAASETQPGRRPLRDGRERAGEPRNGGRCRRCTPSDRHTPCGDEPALPYPAIRRRRHTYRRGTVHGRPNSSLKLSG